MEERAVCPICDSTHPLDSIQCASCCKSSTSTERHRLRQAQRQVGEPAEGSLSQRLLTFDDSLQRSLSRRRRVRRLRALEQRIEEAENEYQDVLSTNRALMESNSSPQRGRRPAMLSSQHKMLERAQMNLSDTARRVEKMSDQCWRYRYRWVDLLFSLFRIKRKGEQSVSIAGLEIEDHFDGTHSDHPAEDVSAALSYLVQVLNLLSRYLGIEFPFLMKFVPSRAEINRFSKCCPLWYDQTVTPDFTLAVRLLDKNIRHLCLRAHVPPKEVEAFHLFPNLFALLQHLSLPQRTKSTPSSEAAEAELSLMNSVMLYPSEEAEPFHTTQLTHWDIIEAPEAEVPRPSNENEVAHWERAMQSASQSRRKNSLMDGLLYGTTP